MTKYHLAVDIGASSGRHMIGYLENGKLVLEEVYRFENRLVEKNGHLCWDIDTLAEHIIKGLCLCREKNRIPETMAIDTWAVDYVLLNENGERISDAVSYRDKRTDGVREELEENGLLSFAEHYRRTGIQFQQFNTVYQLLAQKKEEPEVLEQAAVMLMIPDYLNYLLCGVPVTEYTNATTTALVSAESGQWDRELIRRLGLPEKIFQPIRMPGEVLGTLKEEVREKVGFDLQVILPATHDTGSAYLAVPARDENAVFLSSGTWSLLGVENRHPITDDFSMRENFTNEGGYEFRYRYLKNIMGLWMIQSVRRETVEPDGGQPGFPRLIELARDAEGFPSVVDPDDARFLAPGNMTEEIRRACAESGQPVPETLGEVMQVIYSSLALDYQKAVESLKAVTGRTFTSLNIVGGGSQDQYLNQKTANATGLTVYAGPTEGTALGNLIVQLIASEEIHSLAEARNLIAGSFEIKEVKPECVLQK